MADTTADKPPVDTMAQPSAEKSSADAMADPIASTKRSLEEETELDPSKRVKVTEGEDVAPKVDSRDRVRGIAKVKPEQVQFQFHLLIMTHTDSSQISRG